MNAEKDLFKQFDPPPGGAERLRARLDEAAGESESPGWLPAAAVAVIVMVVVGALVALNDRARDHGAPGESLVAAAPEFDRLLGRPVMPVEPAVTLNDETVTLAAVPSENAKVRIYQIE